MSYFYTSAHLRGDQVYVRGYSNGKPFKETQEVTPYLFFPDPEGEYKTLTGKRVKKRILNSVKDAKEFIKSQEGVGNAEYYGFSHFLYTHLNDEFFGTIDYDPTLIARVSIDIETMADGAFPDPQSAEKEITAVTLSHRQAGHTKRVMFACQYYKPKMPGVAFVLCKDERDLIARVLEFWNDSEWTPDIVTGWNVEGFDITYLVNRTKRILGDAMVKLWSPWRIVQERDIVRGKSASRGGKDIENRTDTVYELFGITVLDYLELYKKFSFQNHESYKLDHIAYVELGERKLDYSHYGSLHEFYLKDFEGYMDYNLDDTIKIDKLDDKLKLIDLVLAMAYNAKVTYQDTMTTTRPWDVLIHNYLMEQKIVVPQQRKVSNRHIMGGYVKDVIPGMYKWVVSFDLNSLYPHIIMQYNISPEMLYQVIGDWNCTKVVNGIPVMDLDAFLVKIKEFGEELQRTNTTASGIGAFFDKSKEGFIPLLMKKLYDDRVVYKKQMIEAQKEYERTKSKDVEKEIARFHNLQMAMKLFLNSGYGALANQYFRWFDPDLAESVTSSGQIATMWIERKINAEMNKLLSTVDVDYVIAADTDSIYINFDPLIQRMKLKDEQKIIEFLDQSCKQHFEPFISKSYAELQEIVNAPFQKMVMKRESIASKGAWVAAKNYVLNVWDSEGVRYSEPKIKMKGVQAVRSSTPMICRDKIKAAYSIIMNDEEDDLQTFVEKFKDEFYSKPFEEVAFPRGANNLDDYRDAVSIYGKGTPIQVRGSLIFNHLIDQQKLDEKYEKIYDKAKIKFAYLKTPNHIRSNVIAVLDKLPPEFGLEEYIDYELQFEKTFIDPLTKITEIVGWKLEKGSQNLMDLLS